MKYLLLLLLLVGCSTTNTPLTPLPHDELDRLAYLIASETYMRETDLCVLAGEICFARNDATGNPQKHICQERAEICVYEALRRWVAIKEKNGW